MMLNNLAHGWHHTKRVMGDAWHGATKLAAQFDSGMKVGRRLLASVAPTAVLFLPKSNERRIAPAVAALVVRRTVSVPVLFGNTTLHFHLLAGGLIYLV
jgi:hypothetical protein